MKVTKLIDYILFRGVRVARIRNCCSGYFQRQPNSTQIYTHFLVLKGLKTIYAAHVMHVMEYILETPHKYISEMATDVAECSTL